MAEKFLKYGIRKTANSACKAILGHSKLMWESIKNLLIKQQKKLRLFKFFFLSVSYPAGITFHYKQRI